MPATVEHKVEMHRLATERKARGLPVWGQTIRLADVFHNGTMTFGQRRDAVVARIRASTWFKGKDEYDDLRGYVDELADVETPDEFDQVWDAIYDEADYDRVWIKTR